MSLSEACRTGYWFCEHCDRIVNLPLDNDSPAHCPRCRKRCAVWMPPAFRDLDCGDTSPLSTGRHVSPFQSAVMPAHSKS